MPFTPNPQHVQEIMQMLQSASSPGAHQQQVHQQLEQFNARSDFNSYLAWILTQCNEAPEQLRMLAGLQLKNNIRFHLPTMTTAGADQIQGILQCLVQALGASADQIRNTTANCVAEITAHPSGGLRVWAQNSIGLVQGLCGMLDSPPGSPPIEGAIRALHMICEDATRNEQLSDQLQDSQLGTPVEQLVPKLLDQLGKGGSVQRLALESTAELLETNTYLDQGKPLSVVFKNNMQKLLQSIFDLTRSEDVLVQRDVCRCFKLLLSWYVYLKPHIQHIMGFMLHQTQSRNEDLSLAACEYWKDIAENESAMDDIKPFLPQLLPVLLECMIYSDSDPSLDDADDTDGVADDAKRIHPALYNKRKAKDTGFGTSEGDDDDDEGDDTDEAAVWNLRKCAATAVDILCTMFGDDLLPVLLPLIERKMNEPHNWKAVESAVLALGAISEGCFVGMRDKLPQVVPFLVRILETDSHKPLVKSITCWTLSRYAKWIVEQEEAGQGKFFEPVLRVLLMHLVSRNKRVQEAACSAFATFEEEAQEYLQPYLQQILQAIQQAFTLYQSRNLFILYDAVVTLSDAVQGALNHPEAIGLLMPPLMHKWQNTANDDKGLLPLLACLTSVAQALGIGFLPFAEGVFKRCVDLIRHHYELWQQGQNIKQQAANAGQPVPDVPEPDREFVVCALDMLSGLADGLGSAIESLVKDSNVLQLLPCCLQDQSMDVRQASCAFVGDLAKTSMPHLRPLLPHVIPILMSNLQPNPVSVCNNACWAIGEIAMQIGTDIEQWLDDIVGRVIPLMRTSTNRNLLENAGITLGRLGLVCPQRVAPHLGEFLQVWCFHLRNVRNGTEKCHAFEGLCAMAPYNTAAVLSVFGFVCDAIASWTRPTGDLKDKFMNLLHGFKNQVGPGWNDLYSKFPPPLRDHLQQMYNLN